MVPTADNYDADSCELCLRKEMAHWLYATILLTVFAYGVGTPVYGFLCRPRWRVKRLTSDLFDTRTQLA